ncbi:MAG: hypothetical protein H6Q35_1367 [Proteobacteria bacterium]|nr:hypothetical protein [Pseudomonadota bacterium]
MFYFGVSNYNSNAHTERGQNILCGPYENREAAKVERSRYTSIDFERTGIFEASNKDEALKQMESENFNRL